MFLTVSFLVFFYVVNHRTYADKINNHYYDSNRFPDPDVPSPSSMIGITLEALNAHPAYPPPATIGFGPTVYHAHQTTVQIALNNELNTCWADLLCDPIEFDTGDDENYNYGPLVHVMCFDVGLGVGVPPNEVGIALHPKYGIPAGDRPNALFDPIYPGGQPAEPGYGIMQTRVGGKNYVHAAVYTGEGPGASNEDWRCLIIRNLLNVPPYLTPMAFINAREHEEDLTIVYTNEDIVVLEFEDRQTMSPSTTDQHRKVIPLTLFPVNDLDLLHQLGDAMVYCWCEDFGGGNSEVYMHTAYMQYMKEGDTRSLTLVFNDFTDYALTPACGWTAYCRAYISKYYTRPIRPPSVDLGHLPTEPYIRDMTQTHTETVLGQVTVYREPQYSDSSMFWDKEISTNDHHPFRITEWDIYPQGRVTMYANLRGVDYEVSVSAAHRPHMKVAGSTITWVSYGGMIDSTPASTLEDGDILYASTYAYHAVNNIPRYANNAFIVRAGLEDMLEAYPVTELTVGKFFVTPQLLRCERTPEIPFNQSVWVDTVNEYEITYITTKTPPNNPEVGSPFIQYSVSNLRLNRIFYDESDIEGFCLCDYDANEHEYQDMAFLIHTVAIRTADSCDVIETPGEAPAACVDVTVYVYDGMLPPNCHPPYICGIKRKRLTFTSQLCSTHSRPDRLTFDSTPYLPAEDFFGPPTWTPPHTRNTNRWI